MVFAKRIAGLLALILLGIMAGCGGSPNYVNVSGVVTLDGKPYKNAIVSFQPIAKAGNPNPGRGSSGLTDESGKFVLVCDDGNKGAVVGKHLIRIRTKVNDPNSVVDPSVGSGDNEPTPPKGKKGEIEPIPSEWFADSSRKEFDIPSSGTDKANFDITTKKK